MKEKIKYFWGDSPLPANSEVMGVFEDRGILIQLSTGETFIGVLGVLYPLHDNRKRKPPHLRCRQIGYAPPEWIIEKLSAFGNRSEAINEALINHYGWEVPK